MTIPTQIEACRSHHRYGGAVNPPCSRTSSGRGHTHAHKQCAPGFLTVRFLRSLLQGRAENELASHVRRQMFSFCGTPDTEEVTVPLISPVEPLTAPVGHIRLCHRITNAFQTQPPPWSGFLRLNRLAAPKTHCHQGLGPAHNEAEVTPPSPFQTLGAQSSDGNRAQNVRFAHPAEASGPRP